MGDRPRHSEMIYRALGSTGEQVSAIGMGGWHLGLKHVDEQLSLRLVRTAVDRGISFMDNSWDYNDGLSELRMIREQIGVLGMMPMANGIILSSNVVTPIECLHYALNLPTSVVITGIDRMDILDQAIEAARTFEAMSYAKVNALLARTARAAAEGEFEPFKTSSIFDSTAQNPAWLGEEPQRLQDLMQESTTRNEADQSQQKEAA